MGGFAMNETKNISVLRSVLYALLAALAVGLAAAMIITVLNPYIETILSDYRETVKPITEKKTVIIDPGHGGADPGAVGINGSREKDINLSLSLAIRDLLVLSGFDVIMTREDDRMLTVDGVGGSNKSRDLLARLKIAEENPDAIFVSIHMNKFPDQSCSGMQVYYSKNDPESSRIAATIRKTVMATVQPENKREIKPATSAIFLLDRIKIPAVLVECGFLSNAIEEALLRDEEYRKALAATVCGALLSCFEEKNENKQKS